MVRRTAIDAAADTGHPAARTLFERALESTDPWIRWKAVHALGDIGLGNSRDAIAALSTDEDFQVRLEVASVLRV
jgi:HEAT repeat protein